MLSELYLSFTFTFVCSVVCKLKYKWKTKDFLKVFWKFPDLLLKHDWSKLCSLQCKKCISLESYACWPPSSPKSLPLYSMSLGLVMKNQQKTSTNILLTNMEIREAESDREKMTEKKNNNVCLNNDCPDCSS